MSIQTSVNINDIKGPASFFPLGSAIKDNILDVRNYFYSNVCRLIDFGKGFHTDESIKLIEAKRFRIIDSLENCLFNETRSKLNGLTPAESYNCFWNSLKERQLQCGEGNYSLDNDCGIAQEAFNTSIKKLYTPKSVLDLPKDSSLPPADISTLSTVFSTIRSGISTAATTISTHASAAGQILMKKEVLIPIAITIGVVAIGAIAYKVFSKPANDISSVKEKEPIKLIHPGASLNPNTMNRINAVFERAQRAG